MSHYLQPIQIRWADIDQNRHLRHSAYYDYGATVRMTYLAMHGLTTEKLEELRVGPVLFREEAVFKREIRLEDKIVLDIEIIKATADFSRWSIRHNFFKEDNSIAAVIQVDGAWIDLVKRKLTVPSEFVQNIFKNFPVADIFEVIPTKSK